jgi:hypothetical protein
MKSALELLDLYVEVHKPVFADIYGNILFCDGTQCVDCHVQEVKGLSSCKITVEEYEGLKSTHPEYFI